MPAGTPLKGLNFEKNKQDPIALADDEYPEWLWTILMKKEDKGGAGDVGGFVLYVFFFSYYPLGRTNTSESCEMLQAAVSASANTPSHQRNPKNSAV